MKICEGCGARYEGNQHNCFQDVSGGEDVRLQGVVDGRYVIERELGRGTRGVVYLAMDMGLGRRVALKVISPELARDAGFIERFRGEAQALASVKHQNVVHIYAFGQHEGTWFYAMELVQGRTLEEVLDEHRASKKTLPTRTAFAIVRQVAQGLAAVHSARIIHRDVKPANILIENETARPVLVDFGIARAHKKPSRKGTFMAGTPAYMAPEQIRAEPGVELTWAVDLYALGCIAFELLTLQTPYNGRDGYEEMEMHLNQQPRPLSTLRADMAGFNSWIERALARNPESRYRSMDAFVDELNRLAAEWEDARSEEFDTSTRSVRLMTSETPVRVLIVSEDAAFREVARQACDAALARRWQEIRTGVGLDAVLDTARRESPELILVNTWNLPEHGIQCLSRLREIVSSSRPRVVVVGSCIDPYDRWRFGALGVAEVHSPDVTMEQLSTVIRRSTDRIGRSEMPGPRPSTLVRPMESPNGNERLPLEFFLLLVACAWSEGTIDPYAELAILQAAREAGHGDDALAAIERACRSPIDLADVDAGDLSQESRRYLFAFATWIAMNDGIISSREAATLHVLAFTLGIAPDDRTLIQSVVEQQHERKRLPADGGFPRESFRRSIIPSIERGARVERTTIAFGIT
jgi:serine/threonine-protein kinase